MFHIFSTWQQPIKPEASLTWSSAVWSRSLWRQPCSPSRLGGPASTWAAGSFCWRTSGIPAWCSNNSRFPEKSPIHPVMWCKQQEQQNAPMHWKKWTLSMLKETQGVTTLIWLHSLDCPPSYPGHCMSGTNYKVRPVVNHDNHFFFFKVFTTVLSQWDFSLGKFGLPSPGKASCDSHATQPTVHAGCFSVSLINHTPTWTTGPLTCAQM